MKLGKRTNRTMSGTLGRAYFERIYAAAEDPWGFQTSAYEARKYDRTLAALGERRFERALEIGCSIGVFTARLAPRCVELVAVDVSAAALRRARRRLAGAANVRIEHRTLPQEMPGGTFDLIVASEVLYYWSRDVLDAGIDSIEARLRPGGLLVAVHWRPPTRDYPLLGDEVHDMLAARLELRPVDRHIEPRYRLEAWEKPCPAP